MAAIPSPPALQALLAAVLVLAACTTTSTATNSGTTTDSPTTFTTAPTTTPPTTSPSPSRIDGVPPDLVTLLDAPMPVVDLTLTGPSDLERWFEEWLRWRTWLGANPTTAESVLSLGLSGSALEGHRVSFEQAITADPDMAGLAEPWEIVRIDGGFAAWEPDQLDQALSVVVTVRRTDFYTVSGDQLLGTAVAADVMTPLALILVPAVAPNGEIVWLVDSLRPVGPIP